MTAFNQNVTVEFNKVDAMAGEPNRDVANAELHCSFCFNPFSLGVGAHDFQPGHYRAALTAPDVGLKGFRIGSARMRADEAKRWAGAGHLQLSSAIAREGRKPRLVEVDDDGAGKAINALAKANI